MVTGTINSKINKPVSEPRKQFVMLKNTAGGLTVYLESYDFSVPGRPIHFKHDQEKNYIPVKWAIGTFITPSAVKQMELGYFTFENLDELIKQAEDLGYYVPDSIKEPKVTLKEMKTALRSGDVKAVEKLVLNISGKSKTDLIALARVMYNNLNQSVIGYLEKKLRVQLNPVNLSE